MKTIGILLFIATLSGSLPAYSKESTNPYVTCMAQTKDQDTCLDKVGRDLWEPTTTPGDCLVVKTTLELAEKNNLQFSYKILYFNERCKAHKQPHYVRATRG